MMFFYPSGSGDHKQQEEIKNAQKPEAGFSGGSTQHDASVFFSIFLEQTNKISNRRWNGSHCVSPLIRKKLLDL